MKHSLVKSFAENIFAAIEEEQFKVLHTSSASRLNILDNVRISSLIIKEVFLISDDEFIKNLMLDP